MFTSGEYLNVTEVKKVGKLLEDQRKKCEERDLTKETHVGPMSTQRFKTFKDRTDMTKIFNDKND